MTRLIVGLCLAFIANFVFAQPKQQTFGIMTGLTVPYTWDQGINIDPRYTPRYELKLAPIGIYYGLDLKRIGFVAAPAITTLGQNFHIINTIGGKEGLRRIKMQYLNIPISVKFHAISVAFLKLSFLAGAGGAILLSGTETVTHNQSILNFPQEVYPALPPEYTTELNGVKVPPLIKYPILIKKDFKTLQWFLNMGIRADYEILRNWNISIDIRGNYGLRETRTKDYFKRIASFQQIYEIAGKRKEMFASLQFGLSRTLAVGFDKNPKSLRKTKKTKR